MSSQPEISLEQKAGLAVFKVEVSALDREQAQIRLVALYREMLLMETRYKPLIAQSWGIPRPSL